MRKLVALSMVALLWGCTPEDPAPAVRVVGVVPEGAGVAPDAPGILLTFSEPVLPDGISDGRYVALVLDGDARTVSSAAGTAAGILRGAPVVPVVAALTFDGLQAALLPVEPLRADTDYAVVVGVGLRTADGRGVLDPTGRRKAWVSTFRTGPMPDRTAPTPSWSFPPPGPVPVNLRELRVAFSEPVTGSLSLAGTSWRPATAGPALLTLLLDGTLPPGLLAPSLDDVRDAAGNRPSALAPLAVRPCRDDAPPVVDTASLRLLPADTSITLEAAAGEPARLGIELLAETAGDACGSLPAPPAALVAWGEAVACPGWDPCLGGAVARCPLSASAGGLCPGRNVRVRLLAEDLAGNRAAPGAWVKVVTEPPVARPQITEVLASATSPQAGGEYAEVANLGSGGTDLAGFKLAKRSASGAVSRCTIAPGGPVLAPGAHGLVVGGAWDQRYAAAGGVPVYHCGASSLLGGIPDDQPPALALESPAGALVSGFGWAQASTRCTGRSTERIHPAGPDATVNYACATASPGTPGACNGNTPAAECPAAPW